MKIIDFRIRPPFGDFLKLGIWNPICNETPPMRWRNAPSQAAREKSLDKFWREMDDAGISMAVAIGRKVPDDSVSVANESVAALAREYPQKIVGFGSLDISRGVSAAMEELEHCLALGLRGIALEPAYSLPPRYADSAVLYPIYARLEKARLPVVLTMSFFQGNLDYSNPVAVQHVAEDFPNLQIVVGHACYPWLPQIFNVCLVHDNVWLLPDLYMLNPDAPGNDMYGQALRWLNGERILFGSSYPCFNIVQAVRETERFAMSPEISEKFFYGNAQRLLGLASHAS